MDIVFLGTAPYGFPVMEDLARRDDTNVKAVITQPDRKRGRGREPQSPPVANYARDLGLPLYQPEDINEEGPTLFDELGNVDLAVVIAYGQILSQGLLEESDFNFYNFHASLLPRWRGAAPIRHTLLAGDDETGVTVFRIQPDLDAGPICVQLQIDVRERENYGSLYERLSQMNVGALRVFLADLEADRLQCKPQEGESTYAPKITSDDARIPWDRPASELENFVLAYNPDPGAFTEIQGDRFKIYDARAVEADDPEVGPGEVVQADDGKLVVGTGENWLQLESVQPAGSRRMDVQSYLAGNPEVSAGTRFE
jgi:methionyl-tRNA formyltransferase